MCRLKVLMKTYQLKLKIKSGILTPFQADTIFGHLCWQVAYQDGEKGLKTFLKPFMEGNPPFVISDGFPGDLLPKPLSAEIIVKDPDERKEMKRVEFISIENFNLVMGNKKFYPQPVNHGMYPSLTIYNTINRLTNTTLAEGGVYSLEETSILDVTIHIKVISEEWKTKVLGLFENLSKSGYGRKKSIGKGQFFIVEVREFKGFNTIRDANGFVTLSNFCPNENDPTEGLYKTFIKYGKLGEEFTYCGNPFKKPLVMIKAGSVFKTIDYPMDYYGRMVENISQAKPEVVHHGYSFAVPIKMGNLNA